MNIAKVLSEQLPHKCISLIEKENYFGQHSQNRTSGVLYDGSYNAHTSQIAKFCKEGN